MVNLGDSEKLAVFYMPLHLNVFPSLLQGWTVRLKEDELATLNFLPLCSLSRVWLAPSLVFSGGQCFLKLMQVNVCLILDDA